MKKLSVHSKKDDAKTTQEDMLNMKGTYNYMDITAFSICRVPMTKNIAIADCGANDIKVFLYLNKATFTHNAFNNITNRFLIRLNGI